MRNTSRVVLWGARRNDIQAGGSTDRTIQISQRLDVYVAAGYASIHKLGELEHPQDVATPGKW